MKLPDGAKQLILVLLSGNLLEDIGNTRSITGVMVAGRWVSTAEIQTGLGH